jgi:hypothetical protein
MSPGNDIIIKKKDLEEPPVEPVSPTRSELRRKLSSASSFPSLYAQEPTRPPPMPPLPSPPFDVRAPPSAYATRWADIGPDREAKEVRMSSIYEQKPTMGMMTMASTPTTGGLVSSDGDSTHTNFLKM